MKPSTLFWCATALAACANVSTPSQTEAARLGEARDLMSGDPDRALRITDELLADNPGLLEARVLAAQGSRMLALDPGRGQSEMFLRDAVTQLERVVDSSDGAPATWQLLAECRFDLGDFEGAAEAALQAAEALRRDENADRERLAAAARLAADAELRTFIAARQLERESGEPDHRGIVPPSRANAELATRAAAHYAAAGRYFPAEAATQTALLCEWLDDTSGAMRELERGIANHPDQAAIHDAYVALLTRLGQREALVGSYRRLAESRPDAPVLRWHYGRALYLRADDRRGQGDFQGAIAGYDNSKAAFGEYAATSPSFADNANQWIALCELAAARCDVEIGDLAGAQRRLFAADAASPAASAYDEAGIPQLVDTFGGHYQGAIAAISAACAERGEDALEATLAFNEAVLERHPDRFGFVYNNAALAARDLGVKRQNAGDDAAAVALWEKSYRYYEKAVELWPDDARTVNDCGLMLVYHLHRDYGRARECFDRAIALGEARLQEMGEDADPQARESVEEAVGDAWQNIAVLLAEQGAPFADYRQFCERAVQYYPHQQREAAAMLRTGGRVTDAAGQPLQGGGKEEFEKAEPEIRKKAEAGDYDGALTLLDKIAKDCKDYGPFQALRGECNLKLAIQARDAGRNGVEFFFQDAATALKRAIELDDAPMAPRVALAQCHYELSDFDNAAKVASEALLHMQSLGGGLMTDFFALHTVRANAAARVYARQKGAGEDPQELLTSARASFRVLEEQDRLDATLTDLWATTELWAGAPVQAVQIYARALEKNPDDQALLGKLVDTAGNNGQAEAALEALKDRKDATGLWYLGKAHYLMAAQQRERQQNDDAVKSLNAAAKAFGASMAQNAGYRASCERWIAMCLGKKGCIAFRANDLENAQKLLLEAVQLCPEALDDDLGLSESIKFGLASVADRYYRDQQLDKVEAVYRAAAEAASSDVFLLNNAGLFARDYGNQLEQAGKADQAREMYEQSYKAYDRARRLDPTNVRLRNDYALIAIYYLERDWDEVKQVLDAAIADGEAQLRDNPPEDRGERQNLDEAVGDCYENLALWHLKHSKDAKAAKAAAEKSQEHYPGQRRPGARRH
ncbi:MAG: hypothetical protein KDE27_08080, partial [Planctomycetes bacterium]|nr:hypothetical protein [Planctomycetota bacterium]